MLSGSQSGNEYSGLLFQINECDEKTYKGIGKCHSQEDIATFLQGVTIETWSNYKKVDYTIHDSAPFIRYDHWLRTDSLFQNKTAINNFELTLQNVETEDSYVSLGQLSYNFSFYSMETAGKHYSRDQVQGNKGKLLVNLYTLSSQANDNLRISYSIMYLIGDIGGVY